MIEHAKELKNIRLLLPNERKHWVNGGNKIKVVTCDILLRRSKVNVNSNVSNTAVITSWDKELRVSTLTQLKLKDWRIKIRPLVRAVFLNSQPRSNLSQRNSLGESASSGGKQVFCNALTQKLYELLIWVSGTLWVSPRAVGANRFSVMRSHKNFMNFMQLTFLFVQHLCTYPARQSQLFAVPHGIYTYEVVSSAA